MNVIASSAGNHAQGVSYASAQLGMHATIVMPNSTPIAKVSATQGYGAEVILAGDNYDACYEEAKRIQRKEALLFIHLLMMRMSLPGRERSLMKILQDLPDADMIVVPAGGGGLLSGISLYAKQINRTSRSLVYKQKEQMQSFVHLKQESIVLHQV